MKFHVKEIVLLRNGLNGARALAYAPYITKQFPGKEYNSD